MVVTSSRLMWKQKKTDLKLMVGKPPSQNYVLKPTLLRRHTRMGGCCVVKATLRGHGALAERNNIAS